VCDYKQYEILAAVFHVFKEIRLYRKSGIEFIRKILLGKTPLKALKEWLASVVAAAMAEPFSCGIYGTK